ncbi:hypothetical protein EWM64_g6463 [Hericium alpestre]|uniref:Glucose-methanol-choline oxidoreductase N-terminal domain-containing protein n=1 Tax=Hericium alpestre TaxID=135208 RepID=A0A4Y9ZVM1_9AGAM|nr:hypothetical protein EWM64_g6463 [Hericium alpestre]
MRTSALFLSPLLALAAATSLHKRAHGVTSDASSAANQTFDYIVVGVGLTGTTVAARLAENSQVSILLLEAGGDDRGDARVYDVYQYSVAFGTELDWAWSTESGRTIHGGKTLGGSSSINGAHWTRGMAAQYDAWSTLLESNETEIGWNRDSLFSYMKKAEAFSAPNDGQRAKGANSNGSYHGSNGPVQVTFPDAMYGGPEQPNFVSTITNLTGIKHLPDVNGGDSNCVSYTPLSINWHADDHRSSSVEAYLTPVENRRMKWLTLTNHQATQILFASGTTAPHTAHGVQFRNSSGGTTYTAHAHTHAVH